MEQKYGAVIILSMCVVVLLIGMMKKKAEMILNFFRAHGGWTGLRIFPEQFFTGKRSGGGSRDQSA